MFLLLKASSNLVCQLIFNSEMDLSERFNETEDGRFGRITLDLALGQGQSSGGGIELSRVADPCDGSELVDGIASEAAICVALCDQGVASSIGGHFLKANAAVSYNHPVLYHAPYLVVSLSELLLYVVGKAPGLGEVQQSCRRLTVVNVPVLFEKIADTAPRVSTVLRDLQRILFLRIMLALIVRLVVRATGRPLGTKATATETQETIRLGTLIQSGCSFLSQGP